MRHEPLMLAEHNASSSFAYLSELERIVWDQRRTAHSTRGHPFALLRRACDQKGFMASSLPNAAAIKAALAVSVGDLSPATEHRLRGDLRDPRRRGRLVNLVIWKRSPSAFRSRSRVLPCSLRRGAFRENRRSLT